MKMHAWEKGKIKIFISHHSSKKNEAEELSKLLKSYNIDAFVAHAHIKTSEEWAKTLLEALKTMDALIALVCEKYIESQYCNQEAGFALAKAKQIVSIKYPVAPPAFLNQLQAMSFSTDWRTTAKKIAKHFYKEKKLKSKFANSFAQSLIKSESFSQSEQIILNLEEVNYIDSKVRNKIKTALSKNPDVFNAQKRVVPSLKKFLKKKD